MWFVIKLKGVLEEEEKNKQINDIAEDSFIYILQCKHHPKNNNNSNPK